MVEILTLIITAITLGVTIHSYRYTREYNKKAKLAELARKKAILKSLQESMKTPFAQFKYDRTATNFIQTKMDVLQIEIKQLEKGI